MKNIFCKNDKISFGASQHAFVAGIGFEPTIVLQPIVAIPTIPTIPNIPT